MYIIAVYDVEGKNCPKYMKVLRKYLFHSQKSVFDGELTNQQFISLKRELIHICCDCILFYVLPSKKVLNMETLEGSFE